MFKSTGWTPLTVNHNVSYRVWVITMRQCRFILGKKCTVLVSDVDNEGDRMWRGKECTRNLCTSLKNCYKSKPTLKKFFKRKGEEKNFPD